MQPGRLRTTIAMVVVLVAATVATAEQVVPDVVGLKHADAAELLERASCAFDVTYDPGGAKGVVVSQTPAGLSPYTSGMRVTITVGGSGSGTAPEPAPVPTEPDDDIGPPPSMPETPVEPAPAEPSPVEPTPPIEPAPVEPAPAEPTPSRKPAGVLDLPQHPVYSKDGPAIPSVLGETMDSASRTLGRIWSVERQVTMAVPDLVGKVVNQWPTPGNTLAEGSPVIVVVAVAKRPSDQHRFVPDVRGKSILDARDALEDAGFNVTYMSAESSVEQFSRAVFQSPLPGSLAALGAEVVLQIGRGRDGGEAPPVEEPTPAEPAPIEPDTPATPEPAPTEPLPVEPPPSVPARGTLAGPKLVSPPKGESYPRAYGATFEWSSVTGATKYEWELQVEQPSGTWKTVDTMMVDDGTRHRPDRMKRGRFRWRVRAFAGVNAGSWSDWARLYMY